MGIILRTILHKCLLHWHFTRLKTSQGHQSAKQTAPAMLSEARRVPATAHQRSVFAPSSSRFVSSLPRESCCHSQGMRTHTLARAGVRTYTHPPPNTDGQITPRPGFSNIPLHKEALGTLLRYSPDVLRMDKGSGRTGKKKKHIPARQHSRLNLRCAASRPSYFLEKSCPSWQRNAAKERKRKRGKIPPSLSRPRPPRPAGFLSLLCTFPK